LRTGLLLGLGAWLFAATTVFAQEPAPLPTGEVVPAEQGIPAREPDLFRYWVGAEYLAYWVKNAPLPFSLVTGDPANPTQEVLNSDQGFGMFSGFRVGLGAWLDPYNNLGLEGNFFALQQRTRTVGVSSDAAGNPTLALAFTNQTPGAVGDTLMPIASPDAFAGSVLMASTLQLWGAEANSVLSWVQGGGFELLGLAGFRYVDLRENLLLSTVSSDLLTAPNTVLSQSDQFNTRNQFYGGQIGGRINWQNERFSLDLTGKVAIGMTHQTVDIQGYSTQTGPGGVNGTFPGGLFTQPSNIGRYSADHFSWIPDVELKLSVFITSQLQAFVGYDFMYWSQVVRPGNQVDSNINLSQSAVLGNGALSGPAYPMPLFNRSDFWAQGLNVGLEFRF
jgi:hypothetical protein